MRRPLTRLSPFYQGQMGVHGSDVPRGIRENTTAIALYVDNDHPDNADAHDGTDPEHPLSTIQGAVTKLVAIQTALGHTLEGSSIVVGGDDYSESVIIPSTIAYCNLLGLQRFKPSWGSGAAADPCLDVRAEGWVVDGFEFECPASDAGVVLQEVPGESYSAYKTVIQNCVFDGLWGGLYGINFLGAPHRVGIYDNWFIEMHQGGNDAFCIYVTDSVHTNPYQCEVIGNTFKDSDNYIGNLASIRGFNVSHFIDNVFEEGVLLIPAIYLDLRGGSRGMNIVTGNFMGGAYTNAGGYWPHAATTNSHWVGNTAEPTPATVADNGLTIAVPA